MAAEEKYHLFTLRVFVKSVSSDYSTEFCKNPCLPTVVDFGFYRFPKDEALKVSAKEKFIHGDRYFEVFNAGRSVTFAINHKEVVECTVDMSLRFNVIKQLRYVTPSDVVVATGSLSLSKEYYAMRKEMLSWKNSCRELDTVVPLTCDPMFNPKEEGKGSLYVYVRMEEHGPTQITESLQLTGIRDYSLLPFNVRLGGITMHYDPGATHSGEPSTSENLHKLLFHNPTLESNLCAPCGKQQKIASEKDESEMRGKGDDGMLPDVSSNDVLSRSSHSSRSPFCKPVVLKVSGLFDNGDNGSKKPTVTVAEPDTAKSDATSSQHDIFVLRIGKKGLVGVNEKSDIQLEMKTPKGSERRPAIRHETRDIQTDLEEAEPQPPRLHLDHRPKEKKRKKKKRKKKK